MAVWAAVCDWPTTLGTATQLPLEMTRLTDVLGGMSSPAAGFCADTSPDENWLEHALDWLPTFRPAWLRVAPAEAGDWPSTLGTFTEVWVPETVSTIGTVDLTLEPPAGSWLSTVPMGLWLDHVVDRPESETGGLNELGRLRELLARHGRDRHDRDVRTRAHHEVHGGVLRYGSTRRRVSSRARSPLPACWSRTWCPDRQVVVLQGLRGRGLRNSHHVGHGHVATQNGAQEEEGDDAQGHQQRDEQDDEPARAFLALEPLADRESSRRRRERPWSGRSLRGQPGSPRPRTSWR